MNFNLRARRNRVIVSRLRNHLTKDEIVANLLKIMIDNESDCYSQFIRSEDVYCKNPWTLFNTREPFVLQEGRYFLANRTEDSGKTDGCESGCWRVMGHDKLIKSEENETIKILGFKKLYKFCEKEKLKSRFFNLCEKVNGRVRAKRIWVMEEYRLASKWKQDFVICKIRLLRPFPLEFVIGNQIRGYSTLTI